MQPAVPERCYKCLSLEPEAETCARCRRKSPLHSVQVATKYDETAKTLVWKLKFAHARAAVQPMAALMAERFVVNPGVVLVPVPTATSRVRQRGYDQAEILAKELAAELALPYRSLLLRHGQSRQVGTSKTERAQHAKNMFSARGIKTPMPNHVVLVDDVLTTGATLEAAARTLKKAGIKQVDAMVFAQA